MNTKTLTLSQSLLPSGNSLSKSDEATPPPVSPSCSNVPKPKQKTWQEILQHRFRYDPETGKLYHKNPSGKRATFLTGKEVGTAAGPMGYLSTTYMGTRHSVHRIIWEMHYGPIPTKMIIDHTNRKVLDNRLSNLRLVTKQENACNQKLRSINTTGIMGVTWSKRDRRYYVFIKVNYDEIYLGSSKDFFKACCLRKSAENKYNFHRNHGKTLT